MPVTLIRFKYHTVAWEIYIYLYVYFVKQAFFQIYVEPNDIHVLYRVLISCTISQDFGLDYMQSKGYIAAQEASNNYSDNFQRQKEF